MSSVTFSPNTLQSYKEFKNFFESNKETDKKRILQPLNTRDRLFEYISEYTSSTINEIRFFATGLLYGLQRKLTPAESLYLEDEMRDKLDKKPDYNPISPFQKSDLLVRTYNYQRLDTPDLYMQKSIPVASIRDPDVAKHIGLHRLFLESNKKREKIPLYHKIGLCRGIVQWFTLLYFETKKEFPDTPEGRLEHIKSVAQLFSRGGPRGASLLQSLNTVWNSSDSNLFNIWESESWSIYLQKTPVTGTRVENLEEFTREIKKLSPGEYEFTLWKHSTFYIKVDQELGVFFDPDRGAILVKGEEGILNLAKYILKCGPEPGGGLLSNLFLGGKILMISKIISCDQTTIADACVFVRDNVLKLLCVITFPLRVCYFWVIQAVRCIYERSTQCFKHMRNYLSPAVNAS